MVSRGIMKLLSLLALAIPFFACFTTSFAQDDDDTTLLLTDIFRAHQLNGKAWMKLDPQSRVMYLTGLEDGGIMLLTEMDEVEEEKWLAKLAYPIHKRTTIKGFYFTDIMEEIDIFYEQASNRKIPIIDAYRYVIKKFKGANPQELATAQSALRRKYNVNITPNPLQNRRRPTSGEPIMPLLPPLR